MRGLLVKDLRLLLSQKKTLLTMIPIMLLLTISSDFTFVLGYFTIIMAMLAMGTISYDEFDNGYPFLFTLPISRKAYAVSKYVLALGMSLAGWVVINVVMLVSRKVDYHIENLVVSVSIFAVLSMLQAVMMPIHMKYGAEKAKIVYVVMLAIIVFLGAAATWFSGNLPDMSGVVEWLSSLGPIEIVAIVVLLAVAVNLISVHISCRIMEKKQF